MFALFVCLLLFFTANHTPHGHAASVWTEDLTLALETAKRYVGQVVQSREVDEVQFLLAADNKIGDMLSLTIYRQRIFWQSHLATVTIKSC